MKLSKSITASVLVAGLSLGFASTSILAVSAGDAWAKAPQSEGKGKSDTAGSNGKAKGAEKSASRGKSSTAGSNSRGAVARELKNLNAMCANENAYASAADGSNVGNIRSYRKELLEADELRADFAAFSADLGALDPDHDADYYLARQDDDTIDGQIEVLQAERAAALWPNESAEYQAELDQLALDLGLPSSDDLTDEDIASITEPHNAEVAEEFDPLIEALGDYKDLLDDVLQAEEEEHDALMVASKNRGLEGDALEVLQTAMRDGC